MKFTEIYFLITFSDMSVISPGIPEKLVFEKVFPPKCRGRFFIGNYFHKPYNYIAPDAFEYSLELPREFQLVVSLETTNTQHSREFAEPGVLPGIYAKASPKRDFPDILLWFLRTFFFTSPTN